MGNVFLTDGKGLTSTSANYLANLAKEQLKTSESLLNNLRYVTTEVELINSAESKVLEVGESGVQLDVLLKRIANFHAFIAWIREAIKYKDRRLNEIENISLESFCKKFNLSEPIQPASANNVTEETIISEMSIKDRNRMLTLEAFSATFGTYIHPDGKIAQARENALYRIKNPHTLVGSGRDAMIYNYTLVEPIEEIEKTYQSLQRQYREYERQLNAIKYYIKEEVNKRNLQLGHEYEAKYKEYSTEYQALCIKKNEYVMQEQERIAKLKIRIPEQLQDTYAYLETLGQYE